MLRLEVFEPIIESDETTKLSAAEAEEMRKSAYENGYTAGWDDATQNLKEKADARAQAVQDGLQALSFTYEEAHAALMRSFHPLVEAMISQVMPEAAKLALPEILTGELDRIAADITRPAITIVCAPAARSEVVRACKSLPALEVSIIEESAYAEAQMTIRFDQQERSIDLQGIVDIMRDNLTRMAAGTQSVSPQREIRHG